MRYIFAISIFFISISYSAIVKEFIWQKGDTFSEYLEQNGIPQSFIKTISADDAKYLSEIQAGEHCYEMVEGDILLQALIPLGEEMQIDIFKDKSGNYHFDIIPIVYRQMSDEVKINIDRNCYSDIDRLTNNPKLGFLLKRLFKGSINFKTLQKGDRIAFAYHQKSRLGKPFGQPIIQGAVIKHIGKNRFAFVDRDGNIWHDTKKSVTIVKNGYRVITKTVTKIIKKRRGIHFIMPLKKVRITSRFSYKRWHPILHKYRPHLGVDFGAKRGTPLYAVASGKVIYAGWMRGYGKVVKILHKNGFVSLYAHMSKIKTRLRRYVHQGQIIGAVGSTGRSTGPHLHFGLYHNSRAVNPLKYIRNSKTLNIKVTKKYETKERYTIIKREKVPIKGADTLKQRLLALIELKGQKAFKWDDISNNFMYVDDIK